jgi:hydroxymethylglutaryl-CoA reductase
MAIEESSVVAAASKAAKFWSTRGGFKATVINTKIGQFILCTGRCFQIKLVFAQHKINFSQKLNRLPQICKNAWWNFRHYSKDKTDLLPNYFQLHATFETKDSMG